VQIALAAIKLAHEATGAPGEADEEDIPETRAPPAGGGSGDRRDRPAQKEPRKGRTEGMTRIFIGAGRSAGVRPQDLVGAITGESDLTGRQIGAIEIADRFSLVEVPQAAVDHVISGLRAGSIRGKRTTVRRERYERA